MLSEVERGEVITRGHPYYHNLPGQRERLTCPCGETARALVLVPGQRLDRCQSCFRELAPYLDASCRLLFVGGGP